MLHCSMALFLILLNYPIWTIWSCELSANRNSLELFSYATLGFQRTNYYIYVASNENKTKLEKKKKKTSKEVCNSMKACLLWLKDVFSMMSYELECYFSLYVQFFSCVILQLVTKFIFMFISIYFHAHSFCPIITSLEKKCTSIVRWRLFLNHGKNLMNQFLGYW